MKEILNENSQLSTNYAISQANLEDLNLKLERQRKTIARSEVIYNQLILRTKGLQDIVDAIVIPPPIVEVPLIPAILDVVAEIPDVVIAPPPMLVVLESIGERLIKLVDEADEFQNSNIVN